MSGSRIADPGSLVPDPRSLDWDSMVLVGRIARPHGLRGEVVVNPETDFVEERFQAGAELWTRPAREIESLTIRSTRLQGRRAVIGFKGVESVEDAATLSGRELRIPEETLMPLAPGSYYLHQLVGCTVETTAGEQVGTVARVDGGSSGSLLAIDSPRGEILVPLAVEICVDLDVAARRIRIKPPEGLLDLNAKP